MNHDLTNCDEISKYILELSIAELKDNKELIKHLNQCDDCANFYQEVLAMHEGIQSMPEHDVSDDVFAQTLTKVQKSAPVNKHQGINPQWATGLAASFVLVAMTGLIYNGSLSEYGADFNQAPYQVEPESPQDERRNRQQSSESNAVIEDGEGTVVEVIDIEDLEIGYSVKQRVMQMKSSQKPAPAVANTLGEIMADQPQSAPTVSVDAVRTDSLFDAKLQAEQMMQEDQRKAIEEQDGFTDQLDEIRVTGSRIRRSDIVDATPIETFERESDQTETSLILQRDKLTKEKSKKDQSPVSSEFRNEFAAKKNQELVTVAKPKQEASKEGLMTNEPIGGAYQADDSMVSGPGNNTVNDNLAIRYLAGLESTEALSFKSAEGYWANTYLPGDANMRWIQAQLKQFEALPIAQVQQNVQPFDYPNNAALGLYLNSDRKTLNESGSTRMRLQVGIQAGQQKGGHRSPLSLALVLDLDQDRTDLEQPVSALFSALLKTKQPSDQISVYLAGANKAPIITPDNFKHGPIQVVLSQIFSGESKAESSDVALLQTLTAANGWLKKLDDPNAVLGSSSVLLVSANKNMTEDPQIESLVQQNAIDGVTLSTVSLSGQPSRTALERLALMGQGHSRVLHGAQDADRLVNEQLLDASRAVARALRLQIKLAEGVQLIDVLDSYSLSENQAQRVREAEQSLDQRMDRNLGIAADRGKDEDGIQMVIPSYFAGDTHVILLDVLVEKPGPVAEVSAKYKDLIYMRNASGVKNLHMESGPNQPGPLEYNVMKNVLAHHLSVTIRQASQAIRGGDHQSAVTMLQYIIDLYQAMRQHIPAWKSDVEMMQDESIIGQYLQLLNSHSSINSNQYQLIADAMNFMSWRKLISHSP